MAIIFRDDIGPYTGKGSKLTKGELDNNFYELLTNVITLQDGGEFGCLSVDATSGSITFNWTDGTSNGPFQLPVATFRHRGTWMNDTTYLRLDTVAVVGVGTFLVQEDHTTPSAPEVFDPAADNGTSGDLLYLPLGESPDVSGFMRFVGDYASGTGYFVGDVVTDPSGSFYVLAGHTASGDLDPGDTTNYKQIAPPQFAPVETVAGSTYEISEADAGKYLRFTAACVVTFPAGLEMPPNAEVHLRQAGVGAVTLLAETGDAVLNPQREGYSTATPWKGATLTAKYVDDDEWDIIGPFGEEATA